MNIYEFLAVSTDWVSGTRVTNCKSKKKIREAEHPGKNSSKYFAEETIETTEMETTKTILEMEKSLKIDVVRREI